MKNTYQYINSTVIVILLILFCNDFLHAQKILNVLSETKNGLRTTQFETYKGDIILYTPGDLFAGDVISGTVVTQPIGKNEKQVNRNRNV